MLKVSKLRFFLLPVLISILTAGYNFADGPAKVDNFTLNDYNGKSHSLKDYKAAKAIVLVFVSTECPVSNAYNQRMEVLHKEFEGKNVELIGINANKEESPEIIKQHARKNNLTFTILKDPNNKIADKLGARVTPEVYVINSSSFEVIYHGRIDDSRSGDNIENQDLKTAVNNFLNGEPVKTAETKAFGCTIKRVKGVSE